MRYIILLLFSFLAVTLLSQDSTVHYLDNNWKETTIEDATCYRIVRKKQENLWVVEDYWMNGVPQFKGAYSSAKLKDPVGEFIMYDHRGTITAVYHYDANSKLDGNYLLLTSDGIKDAEREYSHGKKNGMWKWYYDNGLISWFEQWRNDTLVMLQQFSKTGDEYKNLFNVSIAPKWKNSEELNKYIISKLDIKWRVALKCDLNVFINSKGKVVNVESKSSLPEGLLDDIIKVLKEGPDWLPALNRLRPIDGILEVELILTKK